MQTITLSIDLECDGCGHWILAGERGLTDGQTTNVFHNEKCLERFEQENWLRQQRIPPLLARIGRP